MLSTDAIGLFRKYGNSPGIDVNGDGTGVAVRTGLVLTTKIVPLFGMKVVVGDFARVKGVKSVKAIRDRVRR